MDIDKINDIKAKAADVYWEIQSEIEQKETVEYLYHDCRLEHRLEASFLPIYWWTKLTFSPI